MNVSSDWRIGLVVVIDDITRMRLYIMALLILAWPIVIGRPASLPKNSLNNSVAATSASFAVFSFSADILSPH